MVKHPKNWLDSDGRVWLFQEDFPVSDSIRAWMDSAQWDEFRRLVFILWQMDGNPPLPHDGEIKLSRQSTGETRTVSVAQIYDESGFKLAALVELV